MVPYPKEGLEDWGVDKWKRAFSYRLDSDYCGATATRDRLRCLPSGLCRALCDLPCLCSCSRRRPRRVAGTTLDGILLDVLTYMPFMAHFPNIISDSNLASSLITIKHHSDLFSLYFLKIIPLLITPTS